MRDIKRDPFEEYIRNLPPTRNGVFRKILRQSVTGWK